MSAYNNNNNNNNSNAKLIHKLLLAKKPAEDIINQIKKGGNLNIEVDGEYTVLEHFVIKNSVYEKHYNIKEIEKILMYLILYGANVNSLNKQSIKKKILDEKKKFINQYRFSSKSISNLNIIREWSRQYDKKNYGLYLEEFMNLKINDKDHLSSVEKRLGIDTYEKLINKMEYGEIPMKYHSIALHSLRYATKNMFNMLRAGLDRPRRSSFQEKRFWPVYTLKALIIMALIKEKTEVPNTVVFELLTEMRPEKMTRPYRTIEVNTRKRKLSNTVKSEIQKIIKKNCYPSHTSTPNFNIDSEFKIDIWNLK